MSFYSDSIFLVKIQMTVSYREIIDVKISLVKVGSEAHVTAKSRMGNRTSCTPVFL